MEHRPNARRNKRKRKRKRKRKIQLSPDAQPNKKRRFARKEPKEKVYCICRSIDDGSPMLQCGYCQEWFHFKCFSIEEGSRIYSDQFDCPNCKQLKDEPHEALDEDEKVKYEQCDKENEEIDSNELESMELESMELDDVQKENDALQLIEKMDRSMQQLENADEDENTVNDEEAQLQEARIVIESLEKQLQEKTNIVQRYEEKVSKMKIEIQQLQEKANCAQQYEEKVSEMQEIQQELEAKLKHFVLLMDEKEEIIKILRENDARQKEHDARQKEKIKELSDALESILTPTDIMPDNELNETIISRMEKEDNEMDESMMSTMEESKSMNELNTNSNDITSIAEKENSAASEWWQCSICAFENQPGNDLCLACSTQIDDI